MAKYRDPYRYLRRRPLGGGVGRGQGPPPSPNLMQFQQNLETQAEEQVLTHKYRLQQEGLQTEQARQATIATGGQTPHEGLAAYNSLVQGIQDQRLIFRGETPGVTQSPARRDYNALVEGMRQLETIYHDQQFGDEPPDFQGPNAAMSAEEYQKAKGKFRRKILNILENSTVDSGEKERQKADSARIEQIRRDRGYIDPAGKFIDVQPPKEQEVDSPEEQQEAAEKRAFEQQQNLTKREASAVKSIQSRMGADRTGAAIKQIDIDKEMQRIKDATLAARGAAARAAMGAGAASDDGAPAPVQGPSATVPEALLTGPPPPPNAEPAPQEELQTFNEREWKMIDEAHAVARSGGPDAEKAQAFLQELGNPWRQQ